MGVDYITVMAIGTDHLIDIEDSFGGVDMTYKHRNNDPTSPTSSIASLISSDDLGEQITLD